MVMATKKNTSFLQYLECKICRTHHNLGNKHLYSAHHQKNLKVALKKSLAKVSEAKKNMNTIEVHGTEWEKEKMFWCYFCAKEISKHCVSNSLRIACLGLIHHLSDHEHYENVKKLLKQQRMNKIKPEKYVIKKSDLLSFLETVPAAEERFLQKVGEVHNKHVSKILATEKKKDDLLAQIAAETDIVKNTPAASCTSSHNFTGAHSKNGAASKMNNIDVRKIPPWLLPADITSYSMVTPSTALELSQKMNGDSTIGPTMKDFQEHLKKEQKKHLNPNRVGANFNHEMATPADWLPSYSRIWNKNSRKKSQAQFKFAKSRHQT